MTDWSGVRTWEMLLKKIIWTQLGDIEGKKILDFGSGLGITADYFAQKNDVTAVEISAQRVENRRQEHQYEQFCGRTGVLKTLPSEAFDVILCHNVLEYAADRDEIMRQFARVLKPDGYLSLVKHNRAGRVMQMVVLLNDFDHANSLLDGNDGMTSEFGEIHYYNDGDISDWCADFKITKTMGIRTFWDLQQNQEIQEDQQWQRKMMDVELRVSDMKEYQDIAFFHHLIIRKYK
ncbi:MAG: class I SAM-dependent methyltransferase [Lachnospiraceae bacterium]|nr:class I SAM-dependent methyltransferase [Lachnospiraceae bacterium]